MRWFKTVLLSWKFALIFLFLVFILQTSFTIDSLAITSNKISKNFDLFWTVFQHLIVKLELSALRSCCYASRHTALHACWQWLHSCINFNFSRCSMKFGKHAQCLMHRVLKTCTSWRWKLRIFKLIHKADINSVMCIYFETAFRPTFSLTVWG